MTARIEKRARILIVDDDRGILQVLSRHLTQEGYAVATAETGDEAVARIARDSMDVILLDLGLPGRDGLDVLRQLKQNPETAETPFLVISGRSAEDDEVQSLGIGADDYVRKPFDGRVLMLKIRNALRRRAAALASLDGPIVRQDLAIYPDKRGVMIKDRPVRLTSQEFRILCALAKHPGRVFSREELIRIAWKHRVTIIGRAVDVHINRLRKKLGTLGTLLQTVHGTGYCFKE